MIKTHDPKQIIRDLQQILQSDKKRIGFLFGAGTSCAKANESSIVFPSIIQLTKIVREDINSIEWGDCQQQVSELMSDTNDDASPSNIEEMLSKLEIMAHLVGSPKLLSVDKQIIENVIKAIKVCICKTMNITDVSAVDFSSQLQVDFARWIGLAERKYGIEIFTTNYDYLFEIGLEYYGIPYYDGFIGSYEPAFYPDSVEGFDFLPRMTKLWKIHGSIGWSLEDGFQNKEDKRIVRKLGGKDFLIYPSLYKYANTKKEPYLSLIDRLSKFLQQDEAVLITCGYSFNDDHLNERILTALNHRSCNTAVYALLFEDGNTFNENSKLFKTVGSMNGKISFLGRRSAIIKKQIGKWRLLEEPSKITIDEDIVYFEEDVTPDPQAEIGKEEESKRKGKEPWTGEGCFKLADFKFFVKFLNEMVKQNGDTENG